MPKGAFGMPVEVLVIIVIAVIVIIALVALLTMGIAGADPISKLLAKWSGCGKYSCGSSNIAATNINTGLPNATSLDTNSDGKVDLYELCVLETGCASSTDEHGLKKWCGCPAV